MNYSVFPSMPETSKLLIFTSDTSLDSIFTTKFTSRLNEFLTAWSSHGSLLTADSLIIANRVLLIAIDETAANASGCSIDSLTNFIKSDGASSGVDWFNRHQVLYSPSAQTTLTSLWQSDKLDNFITLIKDQSLSDSVYILNTTVQNLKEARESIIQPFSKSWYFRLL